MGSRRTYPIPDRVLAFLNEAARSVRTKGVRLFLFESVAETFPRSYRGADLDIGFEFDRESGDGADAETTERELRRLLESLPTVRPVDLVDFSTASTEFSDRALRTTVDLPAER